MFVVASVDKSIGDRYALQIILMLNLFEVRGGAIKYYGCTTISIAEALDTAIVVLVDISRGGLQRKSGGSSRQSGR